MKKLLTKLSAFVVAVALILSSMTTVFAKSISDYFTVTGEIKLGETKTVTIEDAVNENGNKNCVYYKFVPAETDQYTLAFNQDDDEFDIGFDLLDVNFSQLNNRTEYISDLEAQVFYAKQGKTYYFALYISNEKDNSTFSIKLDKLVSNTANVLSVGNSKTVNVPTADKGIFYKFTPTESGFYEIVSEGADELHDPYATLYDSKLNEINYDDDSLGGYNFNLKFNAVAGKTYYVEFSAYYANSTYKVNINKFNTDGFTEIKSGDTKTFDIKNKREVLYYTFTPIESGIYKLSSDSGDNAYKTDPYVFLYDSNFKFLDDCDDTYESYDFQLEFTAIAGETYYIGVCGRGVGTKFNFTLEDIKYDEIKSGDTKSVCEETSNKEIYYKFTPTESGLYKLSSDCGNGNSDVIDPIVMLYDKALNFITYDDDSNGTCDFELVFNAIAGETYYIGVYCRKDSAKFDFTLESLTVGELKLGENQNVNIQSSKNTYYKFTPAETGCYVATSDCGNDVNDIDPYVYLYDENFEQLDYNDDRDEDYEFELAYELEAGKTYYYEVNAEHDDVQFKFSIQKHYCFTHQPTSGEPYATFGWNAADYQWYSVSLPETEITDKNSTPLEIDGSKSIYSQTDGWTTDSSTYYWYLFTLDLKEGEKISFETNGYFYDAVIGTMTDYNVDDVSYDGGSLYELTAPKTDTYIFAIYQPETNLKVKVYKGGLTYNKIDGQNTNTLTKYTLGKNYVCKVTANGETYTSNAFECKYAIVHQPTEKELYVKPNIEDGAKYQWYYAESAEVELTDKNTEAVGDMYDSEPATYDAKTGWSGHRCAYLYNDDGDYYVNSVEGAIFFKVKLKKGDAVKFVFDGEVSAIALANSKLNYNETEYIDNEDTVTITAPADGEYYITAYCDYETTLKAYKTPGYKYTKIDGETSQDLKNAEVGKTYACEVTFADGTEEISNVIKTSGWQQNVTGWWYSYGDGTYAIGWAQIGDVWYYFNASGYMVTGWQLINGDWYYFNGSGTMLSNCYVGDYWLTSSGAMATDKWQLDAGGWWYSYAAGGYATGWTVIGGTWYYFNASGYMQTGWQLIGNAWYYFNAGGDMVSNAWVGGYYLSASGAMTTPSWQLDGNGWWYSYGDGTYVANQWLLIDGTWYYFNAAGYVSTGWQVIGGSWYYFLTGGQMVTDWQIIGGSWYYFYADGSMAANTWIGNYWLTASGAMA